MMRKYDHVEDYLEVVAGLRDPATLTPTGFGWFNPIIKLARYDVSVLDSMSHAAMNNGALTQRQGQLALTILKKYQRQLASLKIDVSPLENPTWRKQFREIDQTKELAIDDDTIVIRFPYHQDLITDLRDFGKQSQGRCQWNRESKQWELALTEYNLNWAVHWAETRGILVSDEARQLMLLIYEVEKTNWEIVLTETDQGFEIINAPDSLTRYIVDNCGGFDPSNLIRLLDYSSILGYSIAPALVEKINQPQELLTLLMGKEIIYDQKNIIKVAEHVKNYAHMVDRFPIVIYENDLSDRWLNAMLELFGPDEVVKVSHAKTATNLCEVNKKVVHSIKPLNCRHLGRIPLLVTSSGIIAGGERQLMLQDAEKVVYVADGVYNSKRKNLALDKAHT